MHSRREFLRAVARDVDHRGGVRLSLLITDVIQREIARDFEDPGALPAAVVLRHACARDSEEHLLRQILRSIWPPDDPRQITRETLAVLCK